MISYNCIHIGGFQEEEIDLKNSNGYGPPTPNRRGKWPGRPLAPYETLYILSNTFMLTTQNIVFDVET